MIDLTAVADNWRALASRLARGRCASVVKADAYGLGAAAVAPALAEAGCEDFFVATLDEGLSLRRTFPGPRIFVLHGPPPGAEGEFREARLIPVLNGLDQITGWRAEAKGEVPLPAAIHLDTGMNRLGLSKSELVLLAERPAWLNGIELTCVMSHLACAEEAENVLNGQQLAEFESARRLLPRAPASLANSSGIFLGPRYHFDLVRPGYALYGGNPLPGRANPMRQTIQLKARIIQVATVDRGRSVGYGATHRIDRETRIATIAIGYSDGYPRHLSNRGHAVVKGFKVPVVGRVSMDLATLDVTAIPPEAVYVGAAADLIGPELTIDDLASEAGTIGYEVLTRLGRRYPRRYVRPDASG